MAPKTQIVPEPPAKVAKTSHEGPIVEELEADAAQDSRARISETVGVALEDSTMNLIPTSGGQVLMALSDAGLQFLVAAARPNVGMKSGRYMFEVRVLEVLLPAMPGGRTAPLQPIPRQQCRIGFSKQGSSLFLGETDDSVCFDSDGCFICNKQKTAVAERFMRDNVLGILLNLDSDSPNCHTISLFKDGRRVSKPQKLPEQLIGQALFPHVAFRNITVQVNFGPALLAPLPLKCRSLQDAAAADAVVAPEASQDGKFEILLPIGLPDEGTFDWLEDFLERHPRYVEISDRKIVEWAVGSGLGRPRSTSLRNSNDKPEVTFGIQAIDELTPRKILLAVAPLIPRNYVMMEVKSSLLKPERQELLQQFGCQFRRACAVVVGEPPESFKVKVRAALLKEKQEKLLAEWRLQQEKRKQLEIQQKMLRDMEEAQKKMAQEQEEVKDEAGQEEAKEEEPKAKEEDVEMKEEEPPVAELDAEEQKSWFLPRPVPDIAPALFNSSFTEFSLPSGDEDFAEVRYEWATESASKEYLRSWILSKKVTARVEDLTPSDWFTAKVFDFQRVQSEWHNKQKEFKSDPMKQQAAEVRADKERMYQEYQRQKSEAEADATGAEPAEAEVPYELQGFVPLDVSAVKDVMDIGEGEPLFAHFTFEDWSLLNLRFELVLLMESFRQDVSDPERPGIHEAHLPFYYNRYFRKPLNLKFFCVSTVLELCDYAKDVVKVLENGVLSPVLADGLSDLDMLLRVTELARQERQRRVETGDEGARLRFSAVQHPTQHMQAPQMNASWGKGGGKSWGPWPQQVAARPGFAARPSGPGVVPRAWSQQAYWSGGGSGFAGGW